MTHKKKPLKLTTIRNRIDSAVTRAKLPLSELDLVKEAKLFGVTNQTLRKAQRLTKRTKVNIFGLYQTK